MPLILHGSVYAVGQAVCDTVGYCAAKMAASFNVGVSDFLPDIVKNGCSAYGNFTSYPLRKFFAWLGPDVSKDAFLIRVLGSGVIAPLVEETQRAVIVYVVKKAFPHQQSRCAKATAIVISTLFFALSHYAHAVPLHVRSMESYSLDPVYKEYVDRLALPWQRLNDMQIMACFFSGLSYGFALESTNSILAPLALHAASNIGAYVLDMHKLPAPENIQKMINTARPLIRHFFKR